MGQRLLGVTAWRALFLVEGVLTLVVSILPTMVASSTHRVGPYLTGYIADATGSFTYALLTIAIIMVAAVIALLATGRRKEQLDGSQS